MDLQTKVHDGVLEIRWHGYGVVTAGKLLSLAAQEANLCFQAFPDFGPERMGAPIRFSVSL